MGKKKKKQSIFIPGEATKKNEISGEIKNSPQETKLLMQPTEQVEIPGTAPESISSEETTEIEEIVKSEVPLNNVEKTKERSPLHDPATGKFAPGNPGGPGRPLGVENFKTQFLKALKKLASDQGKTEEEVMNTILGNGIKLAAAGQFQFYKDLMDRLHGQAKAKIGLDHTTGGMPIEGGNQIMFVNFAEKKKKKDDPKSKP